MPTTVALNIKSRSYFSHREDYFTAKFVHSGKNWENWETKEKVRYKQQYAEVFVCMILNQKQNEDKRDEKYDHTKERT